MANIILKRGLSSNIKNTPSEDGALSIAKDTGQIFLEDDKERVLVAESNYIKSVTYPAAVDSNGTLSIHNATVTNSGLMSGDDKAALNKHINNNDIHLSQQEKEWLITRVNNEGNVILQDSVTKQNYMLTMTDGVLELSEAPSDFDAINPTLIDASLNTSYQFVIENGALFLQEV